MRAFKDASVVYKVKYGKPPVIIYDNISRIVKGNPKVLEILQDDAKDHADEPAVHPSERACARVGLPREDAPASVRGIATWRRPAR